jgi:hypothetical protein
MRVMMVGIVDVMMRSVAVAVFLFVMFQESCLFNREAMP